MLKGSFIHIPGVGVKTEKYIWKNGFFSWDIFLKKHERLELPPKKIEKIKNHLLLSKDYLQKKDIHFFTKFLPKSELWRFYPEFKDKVAFLDIETTGLSPYYNEITLIGIFDGKEIKTYIAGKNLDSFIKEINKYSLIITYNGALFDLPFIRTKFPNFVPPPHIDLRFFLRRLDYSGGLKAVEKQLGIVRPKEIKDIDGFGATILWNRYTRGDINSLKLLIEYNVADIMNLKILMEKGYKMMQKKLLHEYKSQKLLSQSFTKCQHMPTVTVNKITNSKIKLKIDKNKFLLNLPKRHKYKIVSLLRRLKNFKKNPLVVGVDLSGSEKKASGWALLRGDHAETKLIKTNEEIIKATIEAKPRIISIDSPLSIPEGRHCFSDNCECRKFGIMRKCERMLRRRGVYVFPCLLPSMKSLTKRGMDLSKKFRRLGFRVIESYPGAAQDILGIIRKRINIDELKQGLIDFGIKGDFVNEKNNHDKLDAITSALVGHFYLANSYEALGSKIEGYLIVPKSTRRGML